MYTLFFNSDLLLGLEFQNTPTTGIMSKKHNPKITETVINLFTKSETKNTRILCNDWWQIELISNNFLIRHNIDSA